jgi:hypothetical protein
MVPVRREERRVHGNALTWPHGQDAQAIARAISARSAGRAFTFVLVAAAALTPASGHAQPGPEKVQTAQLLRVADGSDADLKARIAQAEKLIRDRVTVKLTQNQFDGLVSFVVSAPDALGGFADRA